LNRESKQFWNSDHSRLHLNVFYLKSDYLQFLPSKSCSNSFLWYWHRFFSRHLMASNCLRWLNARINCPLPIHRDLLRLKSFPIEIVSEIWQFSMSWEVVITSITSHKSLCLRRCIQLFCQRKIFPSERHKLSVFSARDTLNLWAKILSIVCDCFCAVFSLALESFHMENSFCFCENLSYCVASTPHSLDHYCFVKLFFRKRAGEMFRMNS
jgi:hypothetical protein